MLKTTTDVLQGCNIVKYIGLIVVYQSYKKGEFEKAFKELETKATELGGNAIIGIRFDTQISPVAFTNASESSGRVIYGTVVKIEEDKD